LDHHYVNYDGKTYGGASAVLEIEEFRGARSIDNLGMPPLGYHEKEDVGGRFIKSGRKLGFLKGKRYKYYKSLYSFERRREVMRVDVNRRKIVDQSTFRKINLNYRMSPLKESASHTSSGTANAEDDWGSQNEDVEGDCGEGDNEDGEINSLGNMVKPHAGVVAAAVKRVTEVKPQRSYVLGPDGKILLVGTNPSATKEKPLETKMTAKGIKGALDPEEVTEE